MPLYKRAIECCPEIIEWHAMLGEALFHTGEKKEGIKEIYFTINHGFPEYQGVLDELEKSRDLDERIKEIRNGF